MGRETFLAPVEWRDGWPVVAPEAMRQLEVEAPTLPLQPWPPEAPRDDFDAYELGLHWTFLTAPQENVFNLTQRPGFLRLWGQAPLLQEGAPSVFAARRQQELWCEVSTQLEFAPTNENEEAGLTVFHRHDFHYDLLRTMRDNKPTLILRKRVGDIVHQQATVPLSEGALRLRVLADPERYRFFYAPEENTSNGGEPRQIEWKEIGSGLTQLLAAEVAASWNGVLLGLYASGNGQTCAVPADFDWFEYRATKE